MVMSGIRLIDAGRCDAHLVQAELDEKRGWNGLAILQIDEVSFSAGGRGRRTVGWLSLRHGVSASRRTEDHHADDACCKTFLSGNKHVTQAHPSLPSLDSPHLVSDITRIVTS